MESFEEIQAVMDQFLNAGAPDDPKTRKKQKILEAAAELFTEQGYRKTSVDGIAQRAGVAKGTVYLYFKNKAEILIHAIVWEERTRVSQTIELLQSDSSPRTKLTNWLANALKISTELPLTSRLLSGDQELLTAIDELPAEMQANREEILRNFSAKLVRAAAGDNTRLSEEELLERAAVFRGLIYFAGQLTIPRVRGGLSIEKYADTLAELLVEGLDDGRSA